ncbi:LysR substrate-binding domain-containing protein [Oceanospirillaceae bacterium]|nr:LysR substrate-binding domain-containing protein [Oceanospirillaceae bacterium]
MGQLEDMHVFVRIVEAGSITQAASQLNLAKSAVSKRLGDLEKRLGTKLINRTTRTSSLSEAGNQYYQRVKLILGEVDSLNGEITQKNQVLSGILKLAVPLSFGISHLTPAIELFMRLHPELNIEMDFSDGKVDIIGGGYDLAFRIGTLPDSSLKARKITPIRHTICASPDYLERCGSPILPQDLSSHKVLKYGHWPLAGIALSDTKGKQHLVNVDDYFSANNGDAIIQIAVAGHGIVILPTFISWDALTKGDLVPILEDYSLPTMHAYAVYPSTNYLPGKVRSLIDFLTQRFGDTPYWDK